MQTWKLCAIFVFLMIEPPPKKHLNHNKLPLTHTHTLFLQAFLVTINQIKHLIIFFSFKQTQQNIDFITLICFKLNHKVV